MKCFRLIGKLEIKNDALVKGVHLEGLRVLGDPEWFAEQYYLEGIDELVLIDVVASLYGRNSLFEMVERVAERIFVPLTVGGGVRSISDARKLLKSGADRVAVNTAAVARPELLMEISEEFGRSTLVLQLDVVRRENKTYEVITDNGREATGKDPLAWVAEAQKLGVGEVLLTSIDRDGTKTGFDLELLSLIERSVDIPLIVSGGVQTTGQLLEVARSINVDGACLASAIHYPCSGNAREIKAQGNKHYLKAQKNVSPMEGTPISQFKDAIGDAGLMVRR